MQKELLAAKRLLVVGDSMLDRYWFGDANRISPEAPVPVVRVVRSQDRLGGASNVALNIRNVGAQVALMSVVGYDEAGDSIRRLLSEADITPKLHVDPSIKTTVKLRLVARQQQIVRVDFEETPQHEVLSSLLTQFEQVVGKYDALLLSDYGKGGLSHITRMIEVARANNIPVLVDPKGSDYDRYKGATIITPNRSELQQVVGQWKDEEELCLKAQQLRDRLQLEALLLTRSEEGMTLFTKDGHVTIPTQAREVFDVSGAGDTVIAVLATMIAAGVPMREAVRIANRAGGIVVGKLGTASVSYAELFE